MRKFTREEWAEIISDQLAAQPELAATTVDAMQEGILRAQDRLRDRINEVSMGLVEALNTKPGHVKRRHEVIVAAIEASTVHPSKWSKDAIDRERA